MSKDQPRYVGLARQIGLKRKITTVTGTINVDIKREKRRDFVTGLNGGSIQEINIITSVALTSYLCWNLLNEVYNDRELNPIIDFTLNWLALLFSITLYSDDTRLLTILLLSPCLLVFLYAKVFRREERPKSTEIVVDEEDKKSFEKEKAVLHLVKKPYITAYRSGMLILTCIAILAVDFPIFPRRFAKVETWGTSLMDLGVGSFVFSNGLVSARSMLKPGPKPSFSRRLKSALRSEWGIACSRSSEIVFREKVRLPGTCYGVRCTLEFLYHSLFATNFLGLCRSNYNTYPSVSRCVVNFNAV